MKQREAHGPFRSVDALRRSRLRVSPAGVRDHAGRGEGWVVELPHARRILSRTGDMLVFSVGFGAGVVIAFLYVFATLGMP